MNIRPSSLFRNDNLNMIKIERPVHFGPRRASAIVDAEGRKILTICNHCYSEKYILIGRTTCADCQPKHKFRAQSVATILKSERLRSRKPSAR
jgi:hypothetical protein